MKPVAWVNPKELEDFVSTSVSKHQCFSDDVPLYLAPNEWQYLTDAEILEIVSGGRILGYEGNIGSYTRELFDKIEAKIKEKNGN